MKISKVTDYAALKTKMSCFKPLRGCINHANKCWHLNVYELDKFRVQLS